MSLFAVIADVGDKMDAAGMKAFSNKLFRFSSL
jgi:hypothetical protein